MGRLDVAAPVASTHTANQSSNGDRTPGKGKGGLDLDLYPLALMVRWGYKGRDVP